MITRNGHQFESVNEPTVSTRNSVATEVLVSICGILNCESNLTTETNSRVASNNFDRFNFRISREYINNCISPSFTFTVHLFNSHIISSSVSNRNCQNSAGSYCNCISITIVGVTIIPLIYQVRHIVVTKVSSQSNFVTIANDRSTNFNSNGRIDTNQNAVNFTYCLASSTSVNHNGNLIRIISYRKDTFEVVGILVD